MNLVGCYTKNSKNFFVFSDGSVLEEIDRGNETIYVKSNKKIPLVPTHELRTKEVETGEILRRTKGNPVDFTTSLEEITRAIPSKFTR